MRAMGRVSHELNKKHSVYVEIRWLFTVSHDISPMPLLSAKLLPNFSYWKKKQSSNNNWSVTSS